jgi:hypothetical protein
LIFPYFIFDKTKDFPLYDSFEYINTVLILSF